MLPDTMKGVAIPSYRDHISYQAAMLAGLCCVISIILYMGYQGTTVAIAQRVQEDKQTLLQQVIPAELYDQAPDETVNVTMPDGQPLEVNVARKNGIITAFAFQTTGKGYGGDIGLIMGINPEGEILGLRVISHSETPGLGDKIELAKSNWVLSFNGHSLKNTTSAEWHVKKDGGVFDQFTGATITPRAVVLAVHTALVNFASKQAEIEGSARHE